ncbi:MAG: Smr/MutS family protein [Proteobacteria bacterium]|nr:Smr/MutS family protein [Pseudomonadota bacterium]
MSLPDEKDPPAAEDAQLFREAVRGVRPLGGGAARPEGPKARARARFTRADRMAVLRESLEAPGADPEVGSGEEMSFHRPQIQPGVLRRLRRGEYRVQREIDLHGLTSAQAKQVLREFLADALERQVRCVRIIHGKGLRSGHRGPVLKSAVAAVLRRTGAVLAYTSARQVDGGTGAVYVLLAP